MAGKYDIGPRIGIEGEAAYREALQGIVSSQKLMDAELRKVSEEFKGQENSIEAVQKKHELLSSSVDKQKDKIRIMREELEAATRAYGENDQRTIKLKTSLTDAETQLVRFEHQLEETNDTSFKLGDTLGNLTQRFGVQLPSSVTQSLNSMIRIDASTVALAGAFAGLVTAVAKIEGKLLDLSKAEAAAADELATTAQITGISTKALQEYAYAAEFVDVSVDTITGAQTKLIKSMDAARDGTEKNVEAFRKLGIEYKNADGTLRDTDTVFWETIDALGRMQSGADRDAAAMELLGKSARDLNPLIEAGSQRMKELADEAENVGYILGDEDVKALTALDDAQQKLQKSNEALQKQIAAQFAPSATKAIEDLTGVVQVFGSALTDSGIVEAFGYILESVVDIIAPLGDMDRAGQQLTRSFEDFAIVLAGCADLISFIVGAGKTLAGILTLNATGLTNKGVAQMATALGYSANGASSYTQLMDDRQTQRRAERSGDTTYYNGQFYGNSDAALYARWLDEGAGMSFEYWKQKIGRNATGTDNWRGGLTWVGEGGPELVSLPRGSQIYSAQESRELAGDTNITLVMPGGVREMAQAVELLKAQRADTRRGGKVRR